MNTLVVFHSVIKTNSYPNINFYLDFLFNPKMIVSS